MTSSKKNSKQAKATVKASPVRFGKKQRAEMIEQFRPRFEEELSEHLEYYGKSRYDNRAGLFIRAFEKSVGCTDDDLIREMCPVCEYSPWLGNISPEPLITLKEQEAKEALNKLGFKDYIKKQYIDGLKKAKANYKKRAKSTFGIHSLNELIFNLGFSLRINFPGITVTAATLILEELLTEKGFDPGEGTIKKYITYLFKKTPHLSIDNWDGDPTRLHPGGIFGTIDGEEIIGTSGRLLITRSGISAALERKISSIRIAAEKAIKAAENSAKIEIARRSDETYLKKKGLLKEKWDKAKANHILQFNGDKAPQK